MLFQKLTILSALAVFVAAQDIGQDDIPSQCTDICAEVVSISQRCDNENNDNDAAELQCVCSATNANLLLPSCEACVAAFDTNDDNEANDVLEVLTRCSFVPTTFNTASASAVLQSLASARSSVLASLTHHSDATTTASSTATSSAATTGSVVSTSSSTASLTTSSSPEQTTNAAPGQGVAKAIGLGALGFALGML